MADPPSNATGNNSQQPTASSGAPAPSSAAPPATSDKPSTPPASAAPPAADPTAPNPAPADIDPAAKPPVDPKATEPTKAADDPKAPDPAKAQEPKKDGEPAKVDLNTVPEGAYTIALEGEEFKDVKLDSTLIEQLTPTFKDAKLTTAQATKLASEFVRYQRAAVARKNDADLATLRADPQFGQLNFGQTQARINEALGAFTTASERETLTRLGMANDPVLVRMFARIGAAMSEAEYTPPGDPAIAPRSTAQKLYGGGDRVATGTKP